MLVAMPFTFIRKRFARSVKRPMAAFEKSMPVTSNPFRARKSAFLPSPTPMSRTFPDVFHRKSWYRDGSGLFPHKHFSSLYCFSHQLFFIFPTTKKCVIFIKNLLFWRGTMPAKAQNHLAQPELNIGLVGHVDHGKTTLVERLSGKWTDTHSEELKRGITIRLGYADVTLRICEKCAYHTVNEKCSLCDGETKALRTISLIDAPGHESLMATMLSGAAIIDGALLLVAANEKCPQPQTREHLTALEITGVKRVIVIQNKIDLASREEALENYRQIKEFLKGTRYENAPIIPISARANVNINALIEAIQEFIPTPQRKQDAQPLMLVARSFDINKPGAQPEKLVGGVIGGALRQGVFHNGDEIEIIPGYMQEEKNRKIWYSLRTKVVSIAIGGQQVEEVGPGGSIGLMTELDPSVVKGDSLTGALAGLPGKLPPLWYEFMLEVHLLKRVVGMKEEMEVKPIVKKEMLMLNVNSAATVGMVSELGKNKIKCVLRKPVCAEKGARVTISRRLGDRFRLIGYGEIVG